MYFSNLFFTEYDSTRELSASYAVRFLRMYNVSLIFYVDMTICAGP